MFRPVAARLLLSLLVALACLASPGARAQGAPKRLRKADEIASTIKVAILELKVDSLTPKEKEAIDRYELTQEVRNLANDVVPGLSVMTAAQVDSLLRVQQIDPEKCEGLCAVDLGRQISADYVIDGAVTHKDGFIVDLVIWDVTTKAQKKGIRPNGPDRAALLAAVQLQAKRLFDPVKSHIERVMEDERSQLSEADKLQREKLAAEAAAKEAAKERELDRLRLQAQEAARAKEAERRAEEEARPRHGVLRKLGWVAVGLGAVAGAASAATAVGGLTIQNDIKKGNYATTAEMQKDSDKISSLNTVSRISAAVAGALVLGGLGLVLFNQDAEPPGVSLGLSPAGLVVAGRF